MKEPVTLEEIREAIAADRKEWAAHLEGIVRTALAADRRQRVAQTGALETTQAAGYLGITKRQLDRLRRAKRITGTKVNYRCWVYERTALDEYLARFRHRRKSVFD
jgi:hypothetical protein